MRKILLFIMLCFTFVSADINEYLSDVYFANGIDTSRKQAYRAIKDLNDSSRIVYPKTYRYVSDWKVSYNHTHGIGVDLYESMLQKIYEDKPGSSLVPFIYNLDEVIGLLKWDFKTLVGKVARKTESIPTIKSYASILAKKLAKKVFETYNKYRKKFTQEQLEQMFENVFDDLIDKAVDAYVSKTEDEIIAEEQEDVVTQKRQYIKSIIDGHGVIIVAHSQGNLFTNRVYNDFTDIGFKRAWMKKYISAIGVASPANNILGKKSPYITFDNDMIWLVPDHLPTNVTNPTRYYFRNALGEQVETIVSVKAHSFLTSYMATPITRNRILKFINEKVNEQRDVVKRPSQWKIKKKIGCLCEEKYVQMTHRFDHNGMDQYLSNEKVKNFSEGKKGKIYRADAGDHAEFVRAADGDRSVDGFFTIEPTDKQGACYALKDDLEREIGYINGPEESDDPLPGGLFTARMYWHQTQVHMELSNKLMSKSVSGCGMAAAGSEELSLYDVYPGTYPVKVVKIL